MQIELTPEIENAVLAASSLTGLTPTEITLRALADYTSAHKQASGLHPSLGDATSKLDATPQKDLSQLRSEAVDRIIARSKAVDAPQLNLPESTSIREWIHLGHKF
ncbi:hypothetical protein BH10ACI4_BH10ACI4_20860 [soil metagenome]